MSNDNAQKAGDGLIAVFPEDDHCRTDQHGNDIDGKEHMVGTPGDYEVEMSVRGA